MNWVVTRYGKHACFRGSERKDMDSVTESLMEKNMSDVFPTVIGLDPGGTTGWSVMCVHPLSLVDNALSVLDNITYWQQGEFTGTEWSHVQEIETLVDVWQNASIVIEDFILQQFNQSRDLLSPVRLTAAIEYELWKDSRHSFRQTPAAAKTTCTDERLRQWGYYKSAGGEGHARDATRHALLFLRRAKDTTIRGAALRHAAWPAMFNAKGEFIPTGDGKEEDGSPARREG